MSASRSGVMAFLSSGPLRPLSLMAKPEFAEITQKIRRHFVTHASVD